jgi:hypothetical protein
MPLVGGDYGADYGPDYDIGIEETLLMAHVRKQIRDFVVAALKAHTAAGNNVYPNRTRLIGSEKLPAIGVSTLDEVATRYRDDPELKTYQRTVQVALDLFLQGDATDDQLDELAEAVEAKMEADDTFGGRAMDMTLSATRDVYSGEGERVAGRKRLTYDVTYVTAAGVPDVSISPN